MASTELRDLRAKITVESDAALDSLSRASGRERSEIVREIIHRWALEQIANASFLHSRLKAEGISGRDGDEGK